MRPTARVLGVVLGVMSVGDLYFDCGRSSLVRVYIRVGLDLTALQPRTGRASRSAMFPERAAPRRPGAAQTVTCLPLHGASKARPRRRPLVAL
jgi:hypothetical protein